jgi:glucokinase
MAAHQKTAHIKQWMLAHAGLVAGETLEMTNSPVCLNNTVEFKTKASI